MNLLVNTRTQQTALERVLWAYESIQKCICSIQNNIQTKYTYNIQKHREKSRCIFNISIVESLRLILRLFYVCSGL